MKHTLIEVKTGIVLELDDTVEKEKKEYEKKSQSELWMEWFIS